MHGAGRTYSRKNPQKSVTGVLVVRDRNTHPLSIFKPGSTLVLARLPTFALSLIEAMVSSEDAVGHLRYG